MIPLWWILFLILRPLCLLVIMLLMIFSLRRVTQLLAIPMIVAACASFWWLGGAFGDACSRASLASEVVAAIEEGSSLEELSETVANSFYVWGDYKMPVEFTTDRVVLRPEWGWGRVGNQCGDKHVTIAVEPVFCHPQYPTAARVRIEIQVEDYREDFETPAMIYLERRLGDALHYQDAWRQLAYYNQS